MMVTMLGEDVRMLNYCMLTHLKTHKAIAKLGMRPSRIEWDDVHRHLAGGAADELSRLNYIDCRAAGRQAPVLH